MKKQLTKKICFLLLSLSGTTLTVMGNPGSHNTHYGKAKVVVSPTGKGKVYLSDTQTKPTTGDETSVSKEFDCNGSGNNDSKTYYAWAEVNRGNGYYFAGWSSSETGGIESNDANGWSFSVNTNSTNQNSPTTVQKYAIFKPVEIAQPADQRFTVDKLSSFYEKTVVFTTTGGDESDDFNEPTVTGTSWEYKSHKLINDNQIEVKLTYESRSTWKGNPRDDEATIILDSKGGSSDSCTFTAVYPYPAIDSPNPINHDLETPKTPVSGSVQFLVQYADTKEDFMTPAFGNATGASSTAWKVDNYYYADGTLTVDYTFTGTGPRKNSALLTLNAGNGGSQGTCTIIANCLDPTIGNVQNRTHEMPTPSATVTGTVAFPIAHIDSKEDVEKPVLTVTSGASNWTVDDYIYANGILTVSYTVKGDGASRTNSAVLTVCTKDGENICGTCTIAANVPAPQVLSVLSGNDIDLQPKLRNTTYTGQAVFEVQYGNKQEDYNAAFGEESAGAGTWKITEPVVYAVTDAATGKGTITVNYTYTTASAYEPRKNSNTLTLKAKESSSGQSCTVNANFPDITVKVLSNEVLVMTVPDETAQQDEVTFAVEYADGVVDFKQPTVDDSRWTIGTPTYTATTPSSGILTVPYTFGNETNIGKWSTTLVLCTQAGECIEVTLRADTEKLSDYDASVTTPAGVTTEYEKWVDALKAANAEDGCTIQLLRNVNLGNLNATQYQEIKQTMTLDLNGKTLSATLTAANTALFKINNTDKNITLTVKDTRSKGTLKAVGSINGALYAVHVTKGNLVWESGNIDIVNDNTGTTNALQATGIYLANGTALNMTGGTITGKHAGSYVHAVYADAGSTADIANAKIYAEANTYAYGVYANAATNAAYGKRAAKVTLTNTDVTATAKTSTYAYGVYLHAVQNTFATGEYTGEYAAAADAVIKGGTITATAATSNAYGIFAVAPVATAAGGAYAASTLTVTDAEISAQAKSGIVYAIQGSGPTTITNCNVVASSSGGYAVRGLFLHSGNAVVSGSTIDAKGTAPNNPGNGIYGVYANATYLNGNTFYVNLIAIDNIITAATTATTGNYAYGVYLHALQSVQTSGTFAGKEYAAASNAVIKGGSITATAQKAYAYGVFAVAPVCTPTGGAYAASSLGITDAKVSAEALSDGTVYAIQGSGVTTVSGCEIKAKAAGATVRGILLQDKEAKISGCTIEAEGTATVCGIYANAAVTFSNVYTGRTCHVDLAAENNTITATTTATTTAYGVYLHAVQGTPTSGTFAGKEYAVASNAVITGGSYTAITKTTTAYAVYSAIGAISDFGGAEAYPVITITGGKFTAEAGTTTAAAVRNGGHLTINGGTFEAITNGSGTANAYGIYTIGGKLKATNAIVTVKNNKKDANYAYGVYSAENAYKDFIGKTFASDVELNNVEMHVYSGKDYAYGILMRGTLLSLTEAKYNALSAANQEKYKDKYAFGEYAAMGNCIINGGSFDITAGTSNAYAVVQNDYTDASYVLSPDGKVFTTATMDVYNARFTVKAETASNAHGIKVQTPARIENTHIDVFGKTGTARALWITNGDITIRNSTLTAAGGGNIYGIYTYANANLKNVGWKASGTLTLDNLTVSATAYRDDADGNPVAAIDAAYGVYLAANPAVVTTTGEHFGEEYACAYNAVITGGSYTATAWRNTAYAVCSATHAVSNFGGAEAYPEITITGGEFNAVAKTGSTAGAIRSSGKTLIKGGAFTATTGTTTAYGFHVTAGTFKADRAVLNVEATTSTAKGVYVENGIIAICGIPYAPQVELNDLDVTVTTGTSGATGVDCKAGVYISQTDATFITYCKNTLKCMNAAGDITNQALYDLYNAHYKRGEFVDIVRKVTVNGGTYKVTAGTTTANGIIVPKTVVSPNKVFVRPELFVKGVDLQVKALNGATANGIQGGGPTTIDDCTIDVSATLDYVKGVYLLDGKANIIGSTITATGGKASNNNSTIYGIYAEASCLNTGSTLNGFTFFVDLTSDNNTVTAKGTGKSVYGLSLGATSTLVNSGTYFGTEVACASSATINKGKYSAEAGTSAYGIYCTGHAVSTLGNAEAYADLTVYDAIVSAKTETSIAYALQTGANTNIEGGIYTALAGTTDARGFYVLAGKFRATGAKLNVTATGASAIGVYASAGLNSYAAIPNATQLELNDLDVTVRNNTTSAYGIQVAGGNASNQTDATFKTLATTNKWLIEIKDADGNGTGEYEIAEGKEALYNLYNENYKRGEFVDIVRNVTLNGGTYNVTAGTSTAYGIKLPDAVISSTGKTWLATALQMRDVVVDAKTETAGTAYGVSTSGPTTIEKCDISATSATVTARGLHIQDNETMVANSDIKAMANGYSTSNGNTDVYGIYANASVTNAGWQYVAKLQLDTTLVTATVPNGNNAYALWLGANKAKATVNTYGNLDKEYAVAASAVINGGVYKATAMGNLNGTPKTGQTAYAIGVAKNVVQGAVSAAPKCIINSGKFWGEANATYADVHHDALKGNFLINDGFFRNKTNVATYVRKGVAVLELPDTRAEYTEGYRYFLDDADITGMYVCEVVGKEKYKTLEEALTYVNNNSGTFTIRMLNDYTLQAGNYVLPANATLLVPYKAGQSPATKAPVSPASGATRVTPSIYLQLTFAEGVNFVVKGNVEVGGVQWTGNPYCSSTGPHGYLYLEKDARIDIESGAKLYAWGYIAGEGIITVKDGAESYEFFQLPDFKGGSITLALYDNRTKKVFLITNYAYQNIESTVIYQYGARAYGAATISMSNSNMDLGNKCLIGKSTDSEALFKMQADKNAWIRKDYHSLTDRTEWTMHDGTEIGSLTITVKMSIISRTLDSKEYVLPLSSNMTINVQSGTMTIPQDIYLMPGAEFNIAKEAALKITSGKTLYLVDTEDWNGYKNWDKPNGGYGAAAYDYYAAYSPTWVNPTKSPRSVFASNKTNLPSAKIFVSGTLELNGGYLCTSAAGANICSTNEAAGKVVFTTAAGSKQLYHCDAGYGNSTNGDVEITEIPMTASRLRNADGSYTATAGTAKGKSYNYIDGEWQMQEEDGCLSVIHNSSGDHYYAQAGAIVEVVPHSSNHTYHSPDGQHLYVYTEKTVKDAGCEWWEVEQVAEGEYRANNPAYENYGVHYTYDSTKDYWVPLMVAVTWSINGSNTTTTTPAYTSPVYVGPAPSKNGSVWTGWTAPDGGFYDRNATLPVATTNITYTAAFEVHVDKYTIVFKNADGKVIDAGLYASGEIPVCHKDPTMEPTELYVYRFDKWSPNVTAVTGPAEYTAQYTKSAREYTIRFVDYDGRELKSVDVPYGATPAYGDEAPKRASSESIVYAFAGWAPELAAVTGEAVYRAQYTESVRTYTVSFVDADGETVLQTGEVPYGKTPVYNGATPTKESTEEYVYTFAGWNPVPVGVTGEATYKAKYDESVRTYTVNFVDEDGETVLQTGEVLYGKLPVYNGATPTKESTEEYEYTFAGWTPALTAVTGDATYEAQYDESPIEPIEPVLGDWLDVVDWNNGTSAVINMNGYTSPTAFANWTIIVGKDIYTKGDRADDRTLNIAAPFGPDDDLRIVAIGKDNVLESGHRYRVPYVYDADATLGQVAEDGLSIVFVHSGVTLTVAEDATLAAVYVAPGAELVIEEGATLVAEKIVLRTDAWKSAVLTDKGTLRCDNVYYSRVVREKSVAYPFGLPFETPLHKVTFSNGKKAVFGIDFGLMQWDGEQRAEKGNLEGGNWVGVNPAETETLDACQGYRFISTSGFYAEYRFPVQYTPDVDGKSVDVTLFGGTSAPVGDRGWNSLCSPYTGWFSTGMDYDDNSTPGTSPENAIKISILNEDNYSYRQIVPEQIAPASPFFYQATATGTALSFTNNALAVMPSADAPKRIVAQDRLPAQWIRLVLADTEGQSDETSIYLHPDKFTTGYQTGYDVVKLSKSGAQPFLWSSVVYGDMAFAALPDNVAQQGIDLTLFAPQDGDMWLTLVENKWLDRLQHLWLEDKQEHTLTDLLSNDYKWRTAGGTVAERFVLYPVMRVVDVVTELDAVGGSEWSAYALGKTIVVDNLAVGQDLRCYDATGRLVAHTKANAQQMTIPVPASGMYVVKADEQVKKVMVNK